MADRERDLVAYFYPSTKAAAGAPRSDETVRAVRAVLGGPGVAVFQTLERADPKERGRLANVVQTEFRKLMQHRIEPVLPRSSAKPSAQQSSAATRRK